MQGPDAKFSLREAKMSLSRDICASYVVAFLQILKDEVEMQWIYQLFYTIINDIHRKFVYDMIFRV